MAAFFGGESGRWARKEEKVKKVSIGVIGTGFIAHHNVPALLKTGRVRIAAACNRTEQKARAFVDKYRLDCPVYTDYRLMCEACAPDAVIIQSPHDLHEEQFIHCAQKGIDVIIEKPLATTYAACVRMMNAMKEHGIKAAVCHTQRYNGAIIAAKEYMETHDVGRLVHVADTIHCSNFWEGRSPWMLSNDRGGGITLNYAVHQVDRVQFLAGAQTRSVFGCTKKRMPGYEVDSSFQLMGNAGEVSYVITCSGYSGPLMNQIMLHFTKGLMLISLSDQEPGAFGVYWGDSAASLSKIDAVYPPGEAYYFRQMDPIVSYLAGDASAPIVTVSYAADIVRAVEALHASSRTGDAVQLIRDGDNPGERGAPPRR